MAVVQRDRALQSPARHIAGNETLATTMECTVLARVFGGGGIAATSGSTTTLYLYRTSFGEHGLCRWFGTIHLKGAGSAQGWSAKKAFARSAARCTGIHGLVTEIRGTFRLSPGFPQVSPSPGFPTMRDPTQSLAAYKFRSLRPGNDSKRSF